jgi:hypothetical protein
MLRIFIILAASLLLILSVPLAAQSIALCGVVDAIDFPIDVSDTLGERYDDFALYRPRFSGNHAGVDLGFNRWGDPVYAVARGMVTLSNLEEWDTEKGVVIIEHTFPDGTIAYSLYGHMEQGETTFFPPVGSCVERGDVVGLIGWPSRGLPHLHYEIRNFMPNEGGPGYVEQNPLTLGWYHPLDFTELWRLRLQPGFLGSQTFQEAPTLPPVTLEDGTTVVAGTELLTGYANNLPMWQITTDGVITGFAALPDNRVAAQTRSGQILVLQGGRFASIWNFGTGEEGSGLETPFAQSGETLAFLTDGGGIATYSPDGTPLWSQPPVVDMTQDEAEQPRIVEFKSSADQFVVALRYEGGIHWRLLDSLGTLLYEETFPDITTLTSARLVDGSWLLVSGASFSRVLNMGQGFTRLPLSDFAPRSGRTARLVTDAVGNSYLYVGDSETTLLSFDLAGAVRWRVSYPYDGGSIAPLMAISGGCLLYTLDYDGTLNVFNSATGELVGQRQIYPGGVQSGTPRARLLRAGNDDRVWIGGGFLSVAQVDGLALAGDAAGCTG